MFRCLRHRQRLCQAFGLKSKHRNFKTYALGCYLASLTQRVGTCGVRHCRQWQIVYTPQLKIDCVTFSFKSSSKATVSIMVRHLALTVVSSLLLTAALTYFYGSTYPYVLASEEARASIVVTESQLVELKAATHSSDRIAYAILGAVVCTVMPLLVSVGQPIKRQLIGAVSGIAAACLGHWFDNHPSITFSQDSMHVLVRWIVMLVPIAIACGIAVGIAYSSPKTIVARIVGAVVGVVIAGGLYGFLAGIVTIAEEKHKIFPFHPSNRAMIIGSVLCFVGLVMLLQYNSEQATLKKSTQSKAE